jgi:adenylylsulfate kinase-like enzyme
LKALRGEIANFTGVSDPYEEPVTPELVVDTAAETEGESLERLLDVLGQLGCIKRALSSSDRQPV